MTNIKRFTGVLISTLIISVTAQSAFAGSIFDNLKNMLSYNDQKVSVKLDGKAIAFPDVQPYVNEDNRTLVPVRFVSEALGCKVTWEDTRQLVTIEKGTTRILLRIGENFAIVNNSKADVKKEFDTVAVLKNDRTMVPLRFVSETLGAGVAWDDANNTVIIRSDGTVEVIATPTPTVTPAPTPTPTSSNPFPDIIIDHSTPKPTPTPNNIPSPSNPIIGNPYYLNGLSCKDDLKRYIRLKDLFKYDDIVAVSGDDNQKDLGKVTVSYGTWNPYQKRVDGYLNVTFSESYSGFKIEMAKYEDKEIQRLREIINIGIIGSQEYKDFIYNTVVNLKNGGKTGEIDYTDGNYFFIDYNTSTYTKEIWGDEAFFVTIWR